jgi:hypothetical protein
MMMNNAVIAPAFSPSGTCATITSIEHVRVLGTAGSQLITARSTYLAASRRRIYVRAPLPFSHQRLTVGRRPYMSRIENVISRKARDTPR